MTLTRIVTIAAFCAACAACSGLPAIQPQPADPAITAKIVAACAVDGWFKPVARPGEALLSAAVPVAALPIGLVTAGVDKVCADPQRFAGDISTVAWLAKQFAAARAK